MAGPDNLAFDVAIRHRHTNSHAANEVRAGLTFGVLSSSSLGDNVRFPGQPIKYVRKYGASSDTGCSAALIGYFRKNAVTPIVA
jgi:hypothetical protein